MSKVLGVIVALVALSTSGVAQAQAATEAVAITDQANGGSIRVFDLAKTDWNAAGAQKWEWKPTAANGFGNLTGAWGAPTDAKLRTDHSGHTVMVTSDSKGLAAVVTYPAGKRVWGANVGGNTHSVELLPNGNVAVAASTGKFVRIYAASQGSSATHYVQYDLDQAHGVYWDGTTLWALGHNELVSLKVGGTAANPTVAKTASWTLPTVDGHDLTPNLGNPDLLWVSTGSTVYEFSKSQHKAVATHPVRGIKSINSLSGGTVLTTQPKPGMDPNWCTDTVNIFQPAGSFEHKGSRTVGNAKIYKARVWNLT